MKWYLLLLNFLSFCALLPAQNEEGAAVAADTGRGGWRYVISPDGLRLRSRPGQQSTTLQTLAFGEKVQVISPKHFGHDTVGYLEYFNFVGETYRVSIDGFWLKVRYKQTEGYMFSAYLSWLPSAQREEAKALNRDFVLLFPSIGCFNNIFYQPGWHWYGVYREGNVTTLKKVKVSFYNLPGSLASDAISTNNNRDLQFIVGSREPLTETTLRPKLELQKSLSNLPLFNSEYVPIDSTLRRYNLGVLADKTADRSNYWDRQKLLVHRDGLRQEIQPPGHDGIWYIVWCGDLDGDGKDDYIIHYGEKGAATVLYLSKPANRGQLVKPVAIYYSGYCC